MIEEIYIDNFRCLVNFRIRPTAFQLWLGNSGTGKSSVCDVLRNIQRVMIGDHVADIFHQSSLTSWNTRKQQTFGVVMNIAGESYEYKLVVEYKEKMGRQLCRIKREELKWKNQTFYLFDGNDAHLYRINWTTGEAEEGTSFSADWSRSVIPTIAEREENIPLIRFRKEIGNLLILKPIPVLIEQTTESADQLLSPNAENFAQWYHHITLERPEVTFSAHEKLREVLPGLETISLREAGDSRKLRVSFRIEDKPFPFDFSTLSDGQQQLIVLYTILESLRRGIHSGLFIDEPDNFVSLLEIEPWLNLLQEVCEDDSQQAIVISHHPEVINRMAHGTELWFSRDHGTHVITKPYPITPGLTPAETMARGWDDE